MKKWLFLLFIITSLSGCDNTTKTYSSYSETLENDSIKSWLPDFFPKNASDIKFMSNLDLNSVSVYFSLPENEGIKLNGTGERMASSDGVNFIRRQDGNITSVLCISSNYNLFNEKNYKHFLLGATNRKGQYYLISVNDEQYNVFC
ncbi:hypothetical protein FJU30_18230 [Affinibrenneria salicis]|uniref:YbbD head domain-containing protein n=1 Tax=Affinibrenneria salicis TaxID=2590031 RepID=A0A5J5FWJ0_9GAMM|nr:hypothetical protein [Affinibrenneria salicis]KAA8997698.1 hypothetical protein FJU30_18230 [Affinibrenneria salicis]